MKKIIAMGVVCASILTLTSPFFTHNAMASNSLPVSVSPTLDSSLKESGQSILANTLFIGDSFTARLSYFHLDSQYGFPVEATVGDTCKLILERIDSYGSHTPDRIVFLAGINDLVKMKTLDQIQIDSFIPVMTALKEKYPDIPIYVQAVFPVTVDYVAKKSMLSKKHVAHYNKLLKEHCALDDSLIYIDTSSFAKTKNGNLKKKLTRDGLHINEEATKKWLKKIESAILEVES